MPRYFFHVRDGHDMPDDIGTELPNAQEARVQAVDLAGRLITEQARTFADGTQWHLEVTDERGMILFRLDFMATDAPSTSTSIAAMVSSRPS